MSSLGGDHPVNFILAFGVFAAGVQHVYIASIGCHALCHGGQGSLFHDASLAYAALAAGGGQIRLVGANLGYIAA